jgi:mRNA-degrading endonuclease toxin of MazEF toxin-antitoxin module
MARFSQLPTAIVIPLSSQQSALRFGGTLRIEPSSTNGLSVASVALVFQMGACDIRRIGQRIGRLSEHDIAAIQSIARQLQGIE